MKTKYELPTLSFPYRISHRLHLLSIPRSYHVETGEGMPAFSRTGVRKSALNAHISDRVHDAALPYLRRLINLKRLYKNQFSPERLQYIDRLIEVSNATIYTKLANCGVNIKMQDTKQDKNKKKVWTESEWKKHTDYIMNICKPKSEFQPEPIERGPRKPLHELLPRVDELSQLPELKIYKRMSQEAWYRDPVKVQPMALKYVISDRVKKLAEPKALPVS